MMLPLHQILNVNLDKILVIDDNARSRSNAESVTFRKRQLLKIGRDYRRAVSYDNFSDCRWSSIPSPQENATKRMNASFSDGMNCSFDNLSTAMKRSSSFRSFSSAMSKPLRIPQRHKSPNVASDPLRKRLTSSSSTSTRILDSSSPMLKKPTRQKSQEGLSKMNNGLSSAELMKKKIDSIMNKNTLELIGSSGLPPPPPPPPSSPPKDSEIELPPPPPPLQNDGTPLPSRRGGVSRGTIGNHRAMAA